MNDELKVMSIRSSSSVQRNHDEIYEQAKKNSCGTKNKKAIQRRKKKIEKIKKGIIIVAISSVALASVGLGINAINNYQDNLPWNRLKITADAINDNFDNIEEEMMKLENEVSETLSVANRVILGCYKNTADNKSFYYDFKGVEERFTTRVAEHLAKNYKITPEKASEFWSNLSEEERDAIMINVCLGAIEVYEGGQDSRGNFVLHVVDLEGYNRYKENHEQFFQEMEEMAKSGTGKLAQMLLEQELGYSLDGYLNNAENARGGRQ